ncbi:hypothetical protein GCM10025858_08710 [Alicyclobacillus sacchari]|nr:hypothetical protein GCM10025858_08710 [Alicyclobacillus sacchari]
MLTRLYAVAFAKKSDLDEYNRLQQEARERDHRRLGKELDIFMLSPEVGQGLPLWLPNGAKIRRTIERYIVDLEESLGYQHVYTPHLASVELYKISGHWEHYHEDMYPPMQMDNEELVLRPMNCPHHMMVYKNHLRSYRELPIRIAELGMMHRYEMSGALAPSASACNDLERRAHLLPSRPNSERIHPRCPADRARVQGFWHPRLLPPLELSRSRQYRKVRSKRRDVGAGAGYAAAGDGGTGSRIRRGTRRSGVLWSEIGCSGAYRAGQG